MTKPPRQRLKEVVKHTGIMPRRRRPDDEDVVVIDVPAPRVPGSRVLLRIYDSEPHLGAQFAMEWDGSQWKTTGDPTINAYLAEAAAHREAKEAVRRQEKAARQLRAKQQWLLRQETRKSDSQAGAPGTGEAR